MVFICDCLGSPLPHLGVGSAEGQLVYEERQPASAIGSPDGLVSGRHFSKGQHFHVTQKKLTVPCKHEVLKHYHI